MSDPHQGQSSGVAPLGESGDAELISAVRGGDLDAYGVLFGRHVEAARRLARQLVPAGDVDDLVSDAFAKVLTVLQRGGGPDLAFRAYLLTSVRRLHVDRMRAGSRVTTTDDLSTYDPGTAFEDTAVAGFDNAAAARAFASLPERWQLVLWHTEVEGQKPAEIAPLLGISANSVSALAYRAREGLRQAFISMHAQDATEDACATTRANLGAYLRGGISKRDGAKVEEHLAGCRECSAIYLELAEVNNDLGAVLAPMLLAGAGAGYLAAVHVGAAGAAEGGVLLLLDRTRDWILHNPVGRVVAGATGVVAASAVIAAVALTHGGGAAPEASRPTATPTVSSPATGTATGTASAPADPGSTPPPRLLPPVSASPPHPTTPSTTTPSTTPDSTAPDSSGAGTQPQIRVPLAPVVATSPPVTIDLTRGATDPNGDPLTVSSATVEAPAHGTVVINRATARALTGRIVLAGPVAVPRGAVGTTITYTPNRGWRGTDTISYVLTDGHGGTVAGRVKVRTPNAAPVARNDGAHAASAWQTPSPITIDVLGNDTDVNHDHIALAAVTRPRHGRAAIAHGAIRYTPEAGLGATSDSFRYTVHDGHGGTSRATVTVHLGALPDRPPTAGAVTVTTPYGTAAPIDLAAHASDPDGDHLSFLAGSAPAHGTVSIGTGGHATYTPDTGYAGADTFGYRVSDGRGGSSSGTVVVTVSPLASDLRLTSTGAVVKGYEHVRLSAAGIPAGHAATFHLRISGITGWAPGQSHSLVDSPDCTLPDEPSGQLDLTCTVATDGAGEVELVHLDFDVAASWSVDATLSPLGFVDSRPGDTTFHRDSADGVPLGQ